MRYDQESHAYEQFIAEAVTALQTREYGAALEHIKRAMEEDVHAPEAQNLLGILAEMTGDLSLAGKHYRAASALSPTYKPASRNLHRITSLAYQIWNTPIDYGDKPEVEEPINCTIVYDDHHIGRVVEKGAVRSK